MPSFTTVFLKCARSFNIYIISFNSFLPVVLVLIFPCCSPDVDTGSHGLNHTQSLECESKIDVKHFISLFCFIYIILLLNFLELKNKVIMLWE